MGIRYHDEIQQRLAQAPPASILSIGPHGPTFFADYLAAHPDCRFTQLAADKALTQLPEIGRVDFALVAETLERLSKTDAGALLARLRDLHAGRFVAVVPLGDAWPNNASRWTRDELMAYGLQRIAEYPEAHGALVLFFFDITQYKQTPDWLNSQYWAHPERFDKFRW